MRATGGRAIVAVMTDIPTDQQPGPAEAPGPADTPPPPAPSPAPPLVRPAHDRVFRGVCAAIGRATGTDPVLWRVLVVVLAFFGGTGIVLYLAGWLLIPEEGAPESEVQRLARGNGVSTGAAIALTVLGLFALFAVLDDGRAVVPLVVVGVVAYLVLRNRQAGTAGPALAAPTGADSWHAPPAWAEPAGAPLPWGPPPASVAYGPPPPPPPRSPLGVLTVSLVALAVGGMLLAGALGASGIDAVSVLAVALLVTGLGLLVGARWGRARGLIALAVVLALALGATASAENAFGDGAGERTWVVTGSESHGLGAGNATLDLRQLAGTERRGLTVEASVGAGELVVLVPEDLRVDLDASVGLGELTTPDEDGGVTRQGGAGLDREIELGPDGSGTVRLGVSVGLGQMEVRSVPAR